MTESWDGGQEVQSNWFKFEKVGDFIKGTLLGKELKQGDDVFADQWVYDLRKADGSTYKVGISVNKSGTIDRLNNCKVGEIIGIRFDSETEPKKKGFHPAKNLVVKSWGMDPEYNEFDAGGEDLADKVEM